MKLIANETIPLKSILYLKSKGIDISSLRLDNASITDEEAMKITMDEDRTIITFDRDYGELIFRLNYKPKQGVIYLRIFNYNSQEPEQLIEELPKMDNINYKNVIAIFDGNGIRQRMY